MPLCWVEISTPGTRLRRCRTAASAASPQPEVVSWSVSAIVVSPWCAASATTSAGARVPSLALEWVCRSMGTGPRVASAKKRLRGEAALGGLVPRPVLVRLGRRAAGLLAAAGVEVVLLRHHDLAPEDADHLPVLVVADGLDVDDAAVVLARRLPLVQDGGLAVDGVAMERGGHVAQGLDLEVRDGL